MRTFFGILLFLSLFPQTSTAAVQQRFCPNQPLVVVLSDDAETVHQICSASDKAIIFLAQFGVLPKRTITIEIIEKAIDSHGYIAYGSYDSRSDRIELMSYSSILRGSPKPEMYGEYFDAVHYQGAIAHEITHAVFQHNSTALAPGPVSQEYLAHAVQIAILPAERREAIISKMDVEAWMPGDAISDIYMAFEPGKFAVKSYKHLMTTSDPAAFIKILLNSKWFYVYVP